jgi:hypothetical protein
MKQHIHRPGMIKRARQVSSVSVEFDNIEIRQRHRRFGGAIDNDKLLPRPAIRPMFV